MRKRNGLIVPSKHSGKRLDQLLAQCFPQASRSVFQRLIASGKVVLNRETVMAKDKRVLTGDDIRIEWPSPSSSPLIAEAIPLSVIFEDEWVLVLNKPANLTVHPGAGIERGTLANALLNYDYTQFFPLLDTTKRPGIVHRLDKDTSGVMVVAKTLSSQKRLMSAFARSKVKKLYLALTIGEPTHRLGSLHTQIGRHPKNRKKMAVLTEKGKKAITHYQVLSRKGKDSITLVLLAPETGRTHQLRVHMANLHCPILADTIYRKKTSMRSISIPKRQMLHAWKLAFPHPEDGVEREVVADIPEDFRITAFFNGIDINHLLQDCNAFFTR